MGSALHLGAKCWNSRIPVSEVLEFGSSVCNMCPCVLPCGRLSSSYRRGTRKYHGVLTALPLLHLNGIRRNASNSDQNGLPVIQVHRLSADSAFVNYRALAAYCPTTGTSTSSTDIGRLLIECDPTSSVFCLNWCCASNTFACLAASPISSCAGRNSQLGALASMSVCAVKLPTLCSCRPRAAADPA